MLSRQNLNEWLFFSCASLIKRHIKKKNIFMSLLLKFLTRCLMSLFKILSLNLFTSTLPILEKYIFVSLFEAHWITALKVLSSILCILYRNTWRALFRHRMLPLYKSFVFYAKRTLRQLRGSINIWHCRRKGRFLLIIQL